MSAVKPPSAHTLASLASKLPASRTVEDISANYTVTSSDAGKVKRSTSATLIAVTLPADLPLGFELDVARWGAGQVTFVPGSGATIEPDEQPSVSAQYATARARVVAADTWAISDGTYTSVEFVAVASAGSILTTSLDCSVPTGVVPGDLLIWFASAGLADAPSLPTGFTSLGSAADGTHPYRVAWKRAASTDVGATITSTVPSGANFSASCVAYRGAADPTGFAAGALTDFSGGTVTFPAGGASADGLWLVLGSLRLSGDWSTTPASHTERLLNGSSFTTRRHMIAERALAGTPGTVTATASGTPTNVRVFRLAVTAGSAATNMATQAELDAAVATLQPLDSDLTAIAALTTTAYGRALLELADAAAARTAIGAGTISTQAASAVAITGGTIADVSSVGMVGAATTTDVGTAKVTGDSNNRLTINADGTLEWGSGSGAADVNLYRQAADVLRTADSFVVAGSYVEAFLFQYASSGTHAIGWCAGTPEGAVSAPVGSMRLRTDGGASTTLYVKESGTGNTGWVAK